MDLDVVNRRLYEDFHFTILPSILRNFDRCSMAHGVEIRVPFMDWRLVCQAFSLPSSSKLGQGLTKLILRRAMVGLMPTAVLMRTTKVGFSSPFVDWINGRLGTFVLDTVHSRAFLESSIWNGPEISKFVLRAYDDQDYEPLKRAWVYIQAAHLMKIFTERAGR